jgi:hypothetical protein
MAGEFPELRSRIGAMVEIHVSRHTRLQAAEVFARVSDHAALIRAPGVVCRVTKPGVPERDGLGAVREVDARGTRFVEEIVAFDAPRRYDYVIRSLTDPRGRRVPFEHERGWIELTPERGGVRIDWHSRFRVAVPLLGWLIERQQARKLARIFAAMLDAALAREGNSLAA